MFGWWWTRLAALGLAVVLGASAACGGEESTPTPAATVVTVSPTATPTPTSVATVPATIQPTLIPTPSLAPTQTATATPLPRPSTPSAPAPLPEAANLILEVTSPPEDSVFASTLVTVAGLTSPDATVSVNGILATPDPRGRFSVDLILSPVKNPMHIEIIATSVAGEQRSLVRTVVYLP